MKQLSTTNSGQKEKHPSTIASAFTTPECLSAAVIAVCQNIEHTEINALVGELSKQTEAVKDGNLYRIESMLLSQAHTLDGLFSRLTTCALTAQNINTMEQYMRLALRAQNQTRATLQTLAEIKEPKSFAFVQQANIGNQVQVNNTNNAHTRTRENQNVPNELLETQYGKWMDTGATSKTSRANSSVAPLEQEHRPDKP